MAELTSTAGAWPFAVEREPAPGNHPGASWDTIAGVTAGEALARFDACHVVAGEAFRSQAGAIPPADAPVGWALDDYALGAPARLHRGGMPAYFHHNDLSVPRGQDLYLSAVTPGRLTTTPTPTAPPIAQVVNTQQVILRRLS